MLYKEEIQSIMKKEGFYGFTRGYSGILIRDCPGNAMYFFLFDLFKKWSGANQD
jgi:hypothetical protein